MAERYRFSARECWILAAVGLGTFMSALDSSIVNVVVPLIGREFHASLASVEWIVTIYLIVVSAALLTFGRLGDLRGHKSSYLAGFGVFAAASLVCGLAPNEWWLVGARGIQAIGAAMLFANSPAILTGAFPPHVRGRVLGLQATMTYLGLTVGPPLGGWLAQAFTWRAVFYINLPIGLAAVFAGWRYIEADHGSGHGERFDIPGAVAFATGLVTLMLALNQGEAWGWGSPLTMGMLAVAAGALAAFIAIQRRASYPMLDLSLFRGQAFSASTLSALLNYVAVYSIVFLMPFYLIDGRHLPTAQAGLVLAAQSIVMAIVAPLSGSLSDRVGSRLPTSLGMLVLGGGLAMLAQLGPHTSLGYVVAALAVCGLGTGVFIAPNNSTLMGSAPKHRQGIAAGILAEARNVGMVLGVGMSGAILASVQHGPGGLFGGISATYYAAVAVAGLGVVTTLFAQSGR